MNVFQQALMSEEEKQQMEAYEQCKRKGYKYITIVYNGILNEEVLHWQGLKTIEPKTQINPLTGEKEWVPVEGAGALYFHRDSAGRKIAHVWDDDEQWNRFWLSRHLNEFDIEDKELSREIQTLKDRAFKTELSEEEALVKEKKQIEKRLAKLQKTEKIEEKVTAAKRGRKKKENGDNKPTVDVDRT